MLYFITNALRLLGLIAGLSVQTDRTRILFYLGELRRLCELAERQHSFRVIDRNEDDDDL